MAYLSKEYIAASVGQSNIGLIDGNLRVYFRKTYQESTAILLCAFLLLFKRQRLQIVCTLQESLTSVLMLQTSWLQTKLQSPLVRHTSGPW